MAEAVVSLGRHIPLLPFAMPGEDPGIAEALRGADALMLGNHGVLTVGPDLETCLLRMELLEQLCQIFLVASQLGGPRRLAPEQVEALQARHEAIFKREPEVAAESSGTWRPPEPTGSPDASRIVAEALSRWGR